MQPTDTELMRRANADDPAAFAELVRRYEPALRKVAIGRLGTAEAAEDVVQEAFLAAFQWRASYDERYTFSTWIWTILLNQCRRYAARQGRRAAAISLDAQGDAPDAASAQPLENQRPVAPFEGLMAEERRQQIDSLLLQLSDVQAEALRLRFFRGLKFQEIADAMSCSLCTAKNRVRWGLLRMSALLQEQDTDPASKDSSLRSGSRTLAAARLQSPPHSSGNDGSKETT